jgi:hypothetical protein
MSTMPTLTTGPSPVCQTYPLLYVQRGGSKMMIALMTLVIIAWGGIAGYAIAKVLK